MRPSQQPFKKCLLLQANLRFLPALCLGLLTGVSSTNAADSVEQFYRGKKINLVIGSSVGGGYDLYARLIGKHFSKYMPGSPTVVISNMAGAGSNVAAAFLAVTAPKDGTYIAALYMGAVVEPLFYGKKRSTHDPAEFNYIGNANTDHDICAVSNKAPIAAMSDTLKKELVIGASAPGGATYDFPAFEKELLGAKLKIVSGYPGSREVGLALDNGEVQGICGQSWGGVAAQYEPLIKSGAVRILAQESNTGHPYLNAMKIPLMKELASNDFQRKVLEVFYAQTSFSRPYAVAKEVPPERVAALRKAFMDTMKDPDFIKDAQQAQLDIEATSGDELQAKLKELYATPDDIVKAIRKVYAKD